MTTDGVQKDFGTPSEYSGMPLTIGSHAIYSHVAIRPNVKCSDCGMDSASMGEAEALEKCVGWAAD